MRHQHWIPIIGTACCLIGLLSGQEPSAETEMMPEDRKILYEVERKLLEEPSIFSNDILVSVEDGVVKLEGFVENVPSSRLAVKTAKRVAGVRSVVNQMIVRPEERPDAEILEDVAFVLGAKAELSESRIEPTVNDGIVRLTGETTSFAMKELAEEAVSRVAGIRGLLTSIKVRPGKSRTTADLQQHVDMLLKYAGWLEPGRVTATVQDSTVELSGSVDTLGDADRLRHLVAVPGVTEVVIKNLEIAPLTGRGDPLEDETELPDEEIRRAVEAALQDDFRVLDNRVKVGVIGGVVSLDGYVGSIGGKRAAEAAARNTKGVSYVYNYLKIRPNVPLPDENLTEMLQGLYSSDVWLFDQGIVAEVDSGRVTLRGTVENEFERRWAAELASMTSGVIEVRNALRVDFETP